MYFKKILLAIALIGLVIIAYFSYYIYNVMLVPNTAFNNEEAFIYVSSSTTYDEVKEDLMPLLKDIDAFDALAKRKKYTTNIKAGKYRIGKDMTNNDIINSIRSKNIPITVAFNNQKSLEELAGRISSQIEADSTDLINAFNDESFLDSNNFSKSSSLGMYLPNSYEFFWNTSASEFRDRMLKEYNRYWNTDRLKKAKLVGLTPEEVLTLASIVHEESKQKAEQPRIAGVYVNRLRDGWPLQADPTLKFAAYQLPEYKNTVIKRVLNEHKEIVSPYNTYMNPGLPPGLITMPDVSAIEAVLNYEKHKYFYFAADAERLGFHKFAKSLSQHNQNARAYQRYLSQQGIKR
ncbi:MAG: endolytic transglycosylase MltG [Flavobacteriaceae bacterium]|nr:endolytic transglycosylase MltG [Flavobacteriaceae bacterium]